MQVKRKTLYIFSAGVMCGVFLSVMDFHSVVDFQGQPWVPSGNVSRHTPWNSVGWYELANEQFKRQKEGVRREAVERGVRVLCWVLTSARNHRTKAMAVKKTWGRRCDKLLFISSENDDSMGTVKVDVKEGRDYLWGKTKAGLRYVYENYRNDADWFLKVDDDTYVIMENLRYMLSTKNASDLWYLGYHFKPYIQQGYMSGGAGYVLSAATLKVVVERGLPNGTLCDQSDTGMEDLMLGRCLENLGIAPGDTRDEFGRQRFFPLPLYNFVCPLVGGVEWIWRYTFYNFTLGLECCSDSGIAFHYMNPEDMYAYEFVINYLRLHRVGRELNRTEHAVTYPETIMTKQQQEQMTELEPKLLK